MQFITWSHYIHMYICGFLYTYMGNGYRIKNYINKYSNIPSDQFKLFNDYLPGISATEQTYLFSLFLCNRFMIPKIRDMKFQYLWTFQPCQQVLMKIDFMMLKSRKILLASRFEGEAQEELCKWSNYLIWRIF